MPQIKGELAEYELDTVDAGELAPHVITRGDALYFLHDSGDRLSQVWTVGDPGTNKRGEVVINNGGEVRYTTIDDIKTDLRDGRAVYAKRSAEQAVRDGDLQIADRSVADGGSEGLDPDMMPLESGELPPGWDGPVEFTGTAWVFRSGTDPLEMWVSRVDAEKPWSVELFNWHEQVSEEANAKTIYGACEDAVLLMEQNEVT